MSVSSPGQADDPTEAIATEVRRLAAAYPTFVYQSGLGQHKCYNDVVLNPPGPDVSGCLIGSAVTNLGYRFDADYSGAGALALLIGLGLETARTSPYARWLISVQARQDQQVPWGRAVAEADAEAGSDS